MAAESTAALRSDRSARNRSLPRQAVWSVAILQARSGSTASRSVPRNRVTQQALAQRGPTQAAVVGASTRAQAALQRAPRDGRIARAPTNPLVPEARPPADDRVLRWPTAAPGMDSALRFSRAP